MKILLAVLALALVILAVALAAASLPAGWTWDEGSGRTVVACGSTIIACS